MASIAPIAGGQYFWVSMLAPIKHKRFASYITGWLTSIAWVAALATGSIFVGTILQGLIILDNPNYEPHQWHGTLLCWAVLTVAVFVNTVPKKLEAEYAGADAAVHMSEEIENAVVNVPRAIMTTMLLNGATGFAIVLAVLFCLGDIDTVLKTPTGFSFIQVFYNGVNSKAGATVMACTIVMLLWCAVIGFLATASRMTWSFAHDQGLPFHRFISRVERRSSIPMIATAVVTIIPALLALIYIGSSTVFEDVVSLSTSGLYASYFIPCSLLLWRRTTGQIRPHSASSSNNNDNENPLPERTAAGQTAAGQTLDSPAAEVVQPQLAWGPWRIPGIWGCINN
ncbi:hypothetical protein MMC08_003230, partial [Hypocenomyce scalaris]|nr:hypothetical protein [Hypocenomyce scalaris]